MDDSKKELWKKVLTFIARVIEVAIAVFFGVELSGIISL